MALGGLLFTSCKKEGIYKTNPSLTTRGIVAPIGFKWESSRIIRFKVSVTDKQYPTSAYQITILDKDPAAGGTVISKGSATLKSAFSSSLYIPSNIGSVYIVKTSPNNAKVMIKVNIGSADINTSIGSFIITKS